MKRLLILGLLSNLAAGCCHCKATNQIYSGHSRHSYECYQRKAMKNAAKQHASNDVATFITDLLEQPIKETHTIVIQTANPVHITEYEGAQLIHDESPPVTLAQVISNTAHDAQDKAASAAQTVKETASAAAHAVGEKVAQAKEGITQTAHSVAQKVSQTKDQMAENIKDRGQKVSDAGQIIKKTAVEVGHDLANAGRTIAQGTKEAAKTAIK